MKPIVPSAELGLEVSPLRRICMANDVNLTYDQINLLDLYAALLTNWNEKVNLISRGTTPSILLTHIIHSLSILFKAEIPGGFRLLDLGTGGGLPGIPLAIARPDISMTLVDSIKKKTTAVESMANHLGLRCHVKTCRAEDLPQSHGVLFDIVVCRAVASLSNLIKWSRPILVVNNDVLPAPSMTRKRVIIASGSLIALKGGDLQLEVEEAKKKTGEKMIEVVDLTFSGSSELKLFDKKLVIVRFS